MIPYQLPPDPTDPAEEPQVLTVVPVSWPDPDDPTREELAAFIGPRADYYLPRWQRALDDRPDGAGFNRWAFLLGFFWLGYRKQYRVALLLGVVIWGEAMAEGVVFAGNPPPFMRVIAGLVVWIVCGLWVNRWYFDHARRVVAEVRALGLAPAEHLKELHARGGTSVLAAVLVPLLFCGVVLGLGVVFGLVAAVLAGRELPPLGS